MLDFYFCDTGFYRQLICTQDSGHESDWEFATVIWKSVGGNQYQQDSMVFEQDGSRPRVAWGELNTFTGT